MVFGRSGRKGGVARLEGGAGDGREAGEETTEEVGGGCLSFWRFLASCGPGWGHLVVAEGKCRY